jgi:hypothetical protein
LVREGLCRIPDLALARLHVLSLFGIDLGAGTIGGMGTGGDVGSIGLMGGGEGDGGNGPCWFDPEIGNYVCPGLFVCGDPRMIHDPELGYCVCENGSPYDDCGNWDPNLDDPFPDDP